jgi:SPP1 family predicted phage head-tail adaptor
VAVRAGRFRHLVTLEELTRTRLPGGGWSESWESFATDVPAAITPLTGQERLRAMQVSATLSHRIEVRYVAGITPAMRLWYDGRQFDVKAAVDVGERHEVWEMLAEEVVPVPA